MTLAAVALGANLGDAAATVNEAFARLDLLPATRVIARSPRYRTAPVGYAGQPDFINAAALVETALDADALLAALLEIESDCGRVRTFRNAPRTLDLDLLTWGELVRDDRALTLPHPRMHERAFVLVPLADIAPDLSVPGRGRVAELLSVLDCSGVERID